MNVILNYFIEANLGLVLFYCFYKLFLNEETSFSFNRTYLLGSIIISLLFPLITVGSISTSTLPTMSAVIPPNYLPEVVITAEGKQAIVEPTATQALSIWTIAKWIYITGFAFLWIRFFFQVGKLLMRIQSYSFQNIHGNGKIIETNTPHPTFSFFHYIFIGNLNDLSEEEKHQIICHEMVHAKKLHSIDILLIEILRIIFWFNPLIKKYKHSIIMVHEFQADADTVLDWDSKKYCDLLARVALLSADFKLANQFTNSLTLKRIKMLNAMKKKMSAWKLAVLVPVIVGFFFVVACQDQVMSEVTEVTQNSTMSVQYPKEVQERLNELKAVDPDANWIVVEFNEEGKAKLEELTKEYGMNFKMSSLKAKDDEYDKTGELQEYWIINFDENAKKVADLSQGGQEVFTIVEESAMPAEGMDEFKSFLSENIQYPSQAKEMGIEGKVFVQFIVDKDGSLSDFQVLKGIGAGCDEEALRVMALSKPWSPAKQRGIIVRQKIVMPIFFTLTGNSSSPSSTNPTEVMLEVNKSSKVNEFFTEVQESATYPGGMSEFYVFANQNVRYPAKAKEMGIEGKVFVQFIVEENGELGNFQIVKGIGAGCDEEVIRLMELSKAWSPAKQNGKTVRQRMVIPISFKI